LVAVERPLEDLLEFADPFDDSQRSAWMRAADGPR
jgi:hypothetical protein